MILTLKDFTRIKTLLDELGIYYNDGNYYENTSEGEIICGHWLEIKETLIETSELSKEDLKYNDWQIAQTVLLYKCQEEEGTCGTLKKLFPRQISNKPLDIYIIV